MRDIRITKRFVDAAPAGSGNVIYWDADLPGFGLRVTPNNSKSYVLNYRMGGRGSASRRCTIGRHGVWTPDEARTEARRLLNLVDQGVDPMQEAKRQLEETVALSIPAYIERFSTQCLEATWRSWKDAKGLLACHVVPEWRALSLNQIQRRDVVALLDRLVDRPATRRKVTDLLNRMFNWAVGRGDIAASPMLGMEKPPVPKARDRVLDDGELARIWNAAGQLEAPFGPMVKLLIATGQRRSEVAGMRWEEINLARATWIIPAVRSKNGEEQIVPLSALAMSLLRDLQPRDAGYVLSARTNAPSGFSRAKRRLDLILGAGGQAMKPWRLHDLRRTLATGMQRLGVRFEVVEATLNHVSGSRGGVAGVYQRHHWTDEKRAAMTEWGAHLMSILGLADEQADSNNVIRLAA